MPPSWTPPDINIMPGESWRQLPNPSSPCHAPARPLQPEQPGSRPALLQPEHDGAVGRLGVVLRRGDSDVMSNDVMSLKVAGVEQCTYFL